MGSAMCGLKRESELPACDVMIINVPGSEKQVEYYFYDGNWPTFKK
jgi:hypothetical protein